MQRYIILSAEPQIVASPFGAGVRGGGAATLAPGALTIETRELDRDGHHDAVRSGLAAPVMPTKLIEPLPGPAAAPAASQWGITAVGADTSPYTGEGVTVAVLDTGIDASHPAFDGVEIVERDFTGEGDGDEHGHGTHCAGTIFGRDVEGQRIGVARGVERAVIAKVLGRSGGDSDMLLRGMQWALDEGANVISMSLGFDFPGMVKRLVAQQTPADLATSLALEAYRGNLRLFDTFMDSVRAREVLRGDAVVVAAAGNESERGGQPGYEIAASLPAAGEGVVSVAAVQPPAGDRYDIAPFSNTFPVVSAPGVGIRSAKAGGGLVAMNGTSMACPHVAGVAALWWEAMPDLGLPQTASTVVARLRANARTTVFADGVDSIDRGEGLVTAPQA